MPSSTKKERGRDRKATRDMKELLVTERKIHALENQLTFLKLGKRDASARSDEAAQLSFVPVPISPELHEHEVVRAMMEFVADGILVYWELGYMGPYIAGRFKMNGGPEHFTYSADANSGDFVQAAIQTLHLLKDNL
jgi:hypothetical protein